MKLDLFETHDRLDYLKKDQSSAVAQGAEDCLKKNITSLALQDHSPYIYLFAHPRTADDSANKRLLWQPRLTKPKPQTNSYLFRAESKTDILEVCWLLPPRELWPEYKSGKMFASDLVLWSIDQFENNRKQMAAPYKDDLSDEKVRNIYQLLEKNRIKGNIAKTKVQLLSERLRRDGQLFGI